MRDIIWTLIIVWVVYKLVDIFRGAGQKKGPAFRQKEQDHSSSDAAYIKKDLRSAVQKGAEKEGEYVDFEEIK
jgi:hypothetical protein